MKKLLALVLALVMTLGLATVGANAAYSDADEISFKEAVDVMTAVGVFQGNGGKFMPKGALDRASAAKLIAYLDLGEDGAEGMPASQVFADVPATHWAAKYIAYCAAEGYIAGAGDGNFYPASELTGYAFGKMLLCVLGYNAKIEKYEGADWTIAVAKRMSSLGIAKGVNSAPSNTLTREEAAQYCFNALFCDKVAYANPGSTITVGGVEIVTGASAAASTDQTLAEALGFDLEKVDADDNADAFGRPAAAWLLDDEVIGEYPVEAALTYTTAVSGGKLYTALGKLRPNSVTIYMDGGDYEADEDFEIASGNSGKIGGAGVLTEVFKDGKDITITMINTYVGEITAVKAAKKNADGEITTPAYIELKEIGYNGVETFETDAFKAADKGTVVLFTWAGEVQSVEVAPIEKDVTVRKLSSGKVNNYTVADVNYLDDIERGGSYDLYFDTYGNLVYNTEVSAPESNNFVYVLRVGQPVGGYDEYGDPINAETAKVLFIDAAGKTTQVDADLDAFPTLGTWNTYTVKDNVYSFNEVDDAVYGEADALSAKTPQLIPGLKANNNTTFVVKTGSNAYKVYEGLKNLPTMNKPAGMTVAGLVNTAGYAKLVYVDATGSTGGTTTSATPVFVLDWVSDDIDDDDNLFSTYTAIVGKELTEIKVADGVEVVDDEIVTLKKNDKGYVTAFEAYDGDYDTYELAEDYAVAYVEGTFNVGDEEAIVLDETVAVYTYDGEDLTAGTVADLDGADEGFLIAMLKSNGAIDYFYLFK